MEGYSNFYRRTIIFATKLAITGLFLLAGCAQTRGDSMIDIISTVKRPSSPADILKNIKIALDNDLVSNSDFYTEKNLQLFFGGTDLKVSRRENENLSADIYGFEDIANARREKFSAISPFEISLLIRPSRT